MLKFLRFIFNGFTARYCLFHVSRNGKKPWLMSHISGIQGETPLFPHKSFYRYHKTEFTSVSRLTFNRQGAVLHVNQLFYDGQSKTDASG